MSSVSRRVTVVCCLLLGIVLPSGVAIAQSNEPGRPVNVRLLAEEHRSVTVAWEPEEGRRAPTGYRIHFRLVPTAPQSDPPGIGWAFKTGFGAEAREGTVRGLTNGSWYEVRVTALHDGDLVWSEQDQVLLARPGTAQSDERIPGRPAGVRVAAEGIESVEVSWAPPVDRGEAPVTGYEVWYERYQGRSSTSFTMSVGTLDGAAGRHRIDGLVDYQQYVVYVAALNDIGRGPFSYLSATANWDDWGPLRLIADHRFARSHSIGDDTWEVWVCDVSDGHLEIDLQETVDLLNREITPYFSWLSGGRYRPVFQAGGRVEAERGGSSDRAQDYRCEEQVETATSGGSDGALIVLDKDDLISYGSTGSRHTVYDDNRVLQLRTQTYPQNGRYVLLTAETVLPASAHCDFCPAYPDYIQMGTVAHEIGHSLSWPHSYGGNRRKTEKSPSGSYPIDEYDNPMDMVSSSTGVTTSHLTNYGLATGTIAVNRYAAGWIDPGEVIVHGAAPGSYLLSPPGVTGSQMVALPDGRPGRFISLGARVAKGYDSGIPKEGVEVYRVDQSGASCGLEADPERAWCTGLDRRTQQFPAPTDDRSPLFSLKDHVYGPGESLTVGSYRVEVIERVNDRFRVWVGNPYKGTFADDEGNAHEASIEELARSGIVEGCHPERKMYCPGAFLTRAHMAQFLIRALGETPAPPSGPSRFSDVAGDAWYRPYVERLAELGITTGYPDGTFGPDGYLTRAQMAVFLTRAFATISAAENPTGVFADVPLTASYVAAVEGALAAGITQGCATTPDLDFCPSQQVTRGQIASFLARALKL